MADIKQSPARVFAVTGKGGVGKTSISAIMVGLLAERFPGARILAIDADPAVGLSTALDITPELTLDDIRNTVTEAAEEGDGKKALELLSEARYRVLDAVCEADGFCFLAVGRPESAGCYCKINSYLKDTIALLCESFDYIVIDGEAGIEQINRRVMEKVTDLILVTDASKKGREVIKSIKDVADRLVMYERAGVIANRLPSAEAAEYIDTLDLPLLAAITSDADLAEYDMMGKSLLQLPDEAVSVVGVRQALGQLLS